MKKVRRNIQWVITYAGIAYLAWCSVYNGSVGARRILVFFAWWVAFGAVGAVCVPDIKELFIKRGRVIPAWLDNSVDWIYILFFIWNGWWLTATALMISTICIESVFLEAKKEKSEEDKDKP